jgi:hypothetical protein
MKKLTDLEIEKKNRIFTRLGFLRKWFTHGL